MGALVHPDNQEWITQAYMSSAKSMPVASLAHRAFKALAVHLGSPDPEGVVDLQVGEESTVGHLRPAGQDAVVFQDPLVALVNLAIKAQAANQQTCMLVDLENLDNQAFEVKGDSLVLTERKGCMAREVLRVLLGLGAGQETWDSMAPQETLALMVISAMTQPTAHAQVGKE